jgi:hypothetical protein
VDDYDIQVLFSHGKKHGRNMIILIMKRNAEGGNAEAGNLFLNFFEKVI